MRYWRIAILAAVELALCIPGSPALVSGMDIIHATCVSLDGKGLLLIGESGVGKSDLALRLIDHGAGLVADDQTQLRYEEGAVLASAPDALFGLLEVRGYGIVKLPALSEAPVRYVIQLKPRKDIDRYPDAAAYQLLGVEFPLATLDPRDASAVAKVNAITRLERYQEPTNEHGRYEER